MVEIIGREPARDWLKSQHGVVVLTGDSGIGKSAVLRSIESTPGRFVARVRSAEASPGAAQRLLLDALAQVLESAVEAATALEAAEAAVVELMTRMKSVGLKEVREVVMGLLLGALRARVGEEAADFVERLAKEFNEAESVTLRERLATARPADVVSDFADLLDAVAKAIECQIMLSIDQAERCSVDDQSFLLDLAGRSLGESSVVISVSDANDEGRHFLGRLESQGLPVHHLLPLTPQAVALWLKAESLSDSHTTTVHQITSGYPFFIEDAIRVLQSGADISGISRSAGFHALLRHRWQSLPQNSRTAAMRLAALVERPPDNFICLFLGLDDVAWSALEQDLLKDGIFIDFGDGYRWFHDRRRDFIWTDQTSEPARRGVERHLILSILELLSSETGVPRWVVSALVVALPQNRTLISELDAHLASVLELDRAKLAVLYGLLELMEPAGELNLFVETSLLVRYVQMQLGPIPSMADALDGLKADGLVFSSADERMSLTTMLGLGTPALAIFLAQSVLTFQRWPIPRVASSLFHAVLAPRMGPFWRASFGAGRESLANQAAFQLEIERRERVPSSNHHALAIRALVDTRQLSAMVIFDGVQARDRARIALTDSSGIALGGAFSITSVHSLPVVAIPSRRTKAVLAELPRLEGSARAQQSKEAALARAAQRVKALSALTTHLTDFERQVLNRERQVGILLGFSSNPQLRQEIVIDTAAARVDEVEVTKIEFGSFDPLTEIRLVDRGEIAADEYIIQQNISYHSTDSADELNPVEWVSQYVDKVVEKFNKSQIPRRLHGDVELLIKLAEEHRKRTIMSLAALQAEGLVTGEELADAESLRYLVSIDAMPAQEMELFEFRGASWVAYRGSGSEPILEVRPAGVARPTIFDGADAWGIPQDRLVHGGDGIAEIVLASLCGYESRDFIFER